MKLKPPTLDRNSNNQPACCLALLCCLMACTAEVEAAESTALRSVAFAARSGPRGATLFTTLTPAQCGIDAFNAYDDPSMWGEHFHEFNSGAIGTGIAIGDYDGDGLPDVYVACKTHPNHLFRNLGGFRFAEVTDAAGVGGPAGPWKQGVAFADVNNDGRLDIYVCRFGAPNLLYINQGDGTFRDEAAARGLAVNDASNMAAFCDYDRDGWLDVYVQTNLLDSVNHPGGQRDHLFHNNRDGTFTDVSDAAGIAGETQGHSATWFDVDEDGWPDLYVANDFAQPDQIYHNNRDGTFTDLLSLIVPHTPHFSMGADVGDLNNDGHADLLVADMAATSRYLDNRGMATLRSALPEDTLHPRAAPQYMQSALYLGTGTGRMLEAARLAGLQATDWTFGVRIEDLDLDGRLDVFFTNGMVREFNNSDLVQRSMNAASEAERIQIMKSSPVLAQRNLAFRNLGDLRFEQVGGAWGLDQVGVSFGAAFGDLDGDGDLDLIYSNFEGNVTVCRNDSDSGHAVQFALLGTVSNHFGVGATVRVETTRGTQVRTLTLARGYLSTSEPVVQFGLGEITSLKAVTVDWPSGRRQTFTNLPADRRYTVTEQEDTPASTSVQHPRPLFDEVARAAGLDIANHDRPLDELKSQPLAPFRMNRPGPAVAIADLDGDGADDIALGGVSGDPGRLISNLGNGQFLSYGANVFATGSEIADGPLLPVDFDADGDLDLIVFKSGVAAPAGADGYQPHLSINGGDGRFSAAPTGILPRLPMSVGAVAAADFDRSGKLAIFVGGRVVPGHFPDAPPSALLAWREGRYIDVTEPVAPSLENAGMVTAALWSDVDNDGWPDLLVAHDWGSISCYLNVGGTHLEDASARLGFSSAGSGMWRSIAAADFNGDGRMDYAVGNTGLNTRYHASATAPTLLYANVQVSGSAPQIVEAETIDGRRYPLRPRDTLVRAIPSLARRFSTAESYAKAELEDVFSKAALDAATRFEVTELRSGVFLSESDGTFRFHPLPRIAQVAPIHGMAAGDFNGNGRTDLAYVGNDFTPVPESGRFDGGIGALLLGDGNGGFTEMEADRSGIVVAGDARGLAVADLNDDGKPDFVVTRNDDSAMVFLNRGRPGNHMLAIALRGSPGNPGAIGSRLTLELADGSTQTVELSAGSGYFSVSTPVVFLGYRDDALPTRLKIRWPDGSVTQQTFDSIPAARLSISHP